MMQFEANGDDVAAILTAVLDGAAVTLPDPGEQLEEAAVVTCETMRIAVLKHLGADKFEVQHLACYAPAHGAHPRHAQLAAKVAKVLGDKKREIPCPICNDQAWLPAAGMEAKTAASFAVSLGYYRGVMLPESEALNKAKETAMEKAFSNVLNNPLVTRIRSEMERSGVGVDDKK